MYLSIDSVHKKDKNYYPQVVLEECKYVVKKRSLSLIRSQVNTMSRISLSLTAQASSLSLLKKAFKMT